MRHTMVAVTILAGWAVTASASDLDQGIALFNQGKYAEAETALRKASGPEASAYLAGSIARQKRYAEAEAPAKTALQAKATHPVATAALGESLVGQKKYDEAIDRLSSVLRANKDVAYAYYWRGQAYQNKRQMALMVDDYQIFLRMAPDAPEAPSIRVLLAGLR